jgi:hypothetical protein
MTAHPVFIAEPDILTKIFASTIPFQDNYRGCKNRLQQEAAILSHFLHELSGLTDISDRYLYVHPTPILSATGSLIGRRFYLCYGDNHQAATKSHEIVFSCYTNKRLSWEIHKRDIDQRKFELVATQTHFSNALQILRRWFDFATLRTNFENGSVHLTSCIKEFDHVWRSFRKHTTEDSFLSAQFTIKAP